MPDRDPVARLARPSLEEIAAAYTLESRWPTSIVARRLNLKPSLARDLVHRARVRGLIPPTTQGRATGPALALDCSICEKPVGGPYFEVTRFNGDGVQTDEPLIVCSMGCARRVKLSL